MALQSFSRFCKLPTEICIKIFQDSMPGPRVVPIRFDHESMRYTTTSPRCPLLSACSLSRKIYLETHHILSFSPKLSSNIYIDRTRDTLFFDTLNCSPYGDLSADLARSPFRSQIQNIAIDAEVWEVLRMHKADSLDEIRVLDGLKSIALVTLQDGDWERVLLERQYINGEDNLMVGQYIGLRGRVIDETSYMRDLRLDLMSELKKEDESIRPPHLNQLKVYCWGVSDIKFNKDGLFWTGFPFLGDDYLDHPSQP